MSKKVKGFKFFTGESDKQMTMSQPVKENAPVAPVPDKKYIKGTPEWKAHKAAQKPRTGMPTNTTCEEVLDELSKETLTRYKEKAGKALDWAKGKLTRAIDNNEYKDSMDASRVVDNRKQGLKKADKRLGEEIETLDEKSIQARRNKTYKNLMAASKGARVNRDLGMTPADTGHKNNQQMNKAIGRAISRGEVHEAQYAGLEKENKPGKIKTEMGGSPNAAKSETVEGWEDTKKVKKEETMKSYKEFLQSLEEKLIGGQKKLDKNHNGKLDAQDFKMLRKEETESLDEMEFDKSGRYVHKGSYGSSYNPKPGHEETPEDEKAETKAAGRKAGQKTGSYKPRKTISKLKSAGATYK